MARFYKLAHILFDDYEDVYTRGLSGPLQKQFRHRIRKDRVLEYVSEQILSQLGDELNTAEKLNPAKAAVLKLTANDVQGACELLKQSQNFRLMLLVSQLPGADDTFKGDMKLQLDAWREQKTLSEIDCDIRALYEICAGNVTISTGRDGKGVPVEDRAETFTISTRYNLSWLQCFTLGLLYGRAEMKTGEGLAKIEDAVREYQARCDKGEEPVKPADDDACWALLKLYASRQDRSVTAPDFPSSLEGLATSWNHGDLFDAYNAVKATLKIATNSESADDLAATVASEFSAKDDLASAIYALTHLSDTETCKTSIQDLLDRFAASLPGSDTATSNSGIALWQRLTIDLKVPTSWIFMSKARYAASDTNNGGDSISELRFLVAAEAWDAAHECLLKRVAPAFVIDEDHTGLVQICSLFNRDDDPARRVTNWHEGGAVFMNFGRLMIGDIAKNDETTLRELRKRLVAMGRRQVARKEEIKLGSLSKHELYEHVATKEMANTLARLRSAGVEIGTAKEVLELPVTDDLRREIEVGMGGKDDVEASATATARVRTRKQGLGVRGMGFSSSSQVQIDEDMPDAADGSRA